MPSSSSGRRAFLQKAGLMAGASIGLALPVSSLLQEAKPDCNVELDKIKKRAGDAHFSQLRETAKYLKKLREVYGPGVLEHVKTVTIDTARENMERAPIPKDKRNLEQVKQLMTGIAPYVDYKWVEDTPERLQARVTRCRWAEEMKQAGAAGELGYALICAGDYGFCAGLNPAMKFTRTKTLMQGDDHCNHLFELKVRT